MRCSSSVSSHFFPCATSYGWINANVAVLIIAIVVGVAVGVTQANQSAKSN